MTERNSEDNFQRNFSMILQEILLSGPELLIVSLTWLLMTLAESDTMMTMTMVMKMMMTRAMVIIIELMAMMMMMVLCNVREITSDHLRLVVLIYVKFLRNRILNFHVKRS